MLGRAWGRALEAGALGAALLLALVALLVTADVVARNVGLGSLPWILEASEYALPLATFLIAPWLLRQGQHVRLDVLVQVLPRAAGQALDRLADLLGLTVSAVFVVWGVRTVLDSAGQGSMILKSVVFPEWWLYAPVPVCFLCLAVEFARRLRSAGPAREAAEPTAREAAEPTDGRD